MAWRDARAALRTLLRGLGAPVYVIIPEALEEPGPIIALIPPARSEERRSSAVVRTTYRQVIRVMAYMPNEGDTVLDAIADDMDDLVERINVALRGSLTLGGTAVVVGAPDWDELTPAEFPEGAGIPYLVMECTLPIEVETIQAFAP